MTQEEKSKAIEFAKKLEELIKFWAETVNESDEVDAAEARFKFLGEYARAQDHGIYLAWGMVLLGLSYSAVFNGTMTSEKFAEMFDIFEPLVSELLEKPDGPTH